MVLPLYLNSQTVPGIYVSEDVAGVIPASLASHTTAYMLGTTTQPGAPRGVPTFIRSPEDFLNVFGASPSAAAVSMFFAQRSGGGLYFLAIAPRATRTVTLANPTAGKVYSLVIAGYTVSVTATAAETVTAIRSRLATLVNQSVPSLAWMASDGTLKIKAGTTVTGNTDTTVGTEAAPVTTPGLQDIAANLASAFRKEDRQGYLLAPEFFQSYTAVSDTQALQGILDAHCEDPRFKWVALVDCGGYVGNPSDARLALGLVTTERSGLSSARGHSWYYFPYLKDLAGTVVPASAAIAGLAIRRSIRQGFKEPPAGTEYPLYSVKSLTVEVDDVTQSILNPQGINCIRSLPFDGIVAWGARTLSSSPFYRYGHTRVILNVLEGTLRDAYRSIVFSTVDGLGAKMAQVKGTAAGICEDLRTNGALYGSSPQDAYRVICDSTNNPPSQLEAGALYADVLVKPSPMIEFLGVRVIRTSLGTAFDELVTANVEERL